MIEYITIKIVKISAEFMLSVMHSSDPKDVTIRDTHRHNRISLEKNFNLEGQPEGLVGGPAGGDDGVESLKEGHAAGLTLLPLHSPSLNSTG